MNAILLGGFIMSNFNKRFNNLCARVNFWFNLTNHLAGSEKLLKAQGHLTPELNGRNMPPLKHKQEAVNAGKEIYSIGQDRP